MGFWKNICCTCCVECCYECWCETDTERQLRENRASLHAAQRELAVAHQKLLFYTDHAEILNAAGKQNVLNDLRKTLQDLEYRILQLQAEQLELLPCPESAAERGIAKESGGRNHPE